LVAEIASIPRRSSLTEAPLKCAINM